MTEAKALAMLKKCYPGFLGSLQQSDRERYYQWYRGCLIVEVVWTDRKDFIVYQENHFGDLCWVNRYPSLAAAKSKVDEILGPPNQGKLR